MVPVESHISIDDLTMVLTSASRLLTEFAALKPFESASMGLAEWIALAVLEKRGALSSKQLSRILGVSRLRSNQLLNSLSEQELVTIRESSEDRRATGEVSPKGEKQLKAVNSDLQIFLSKALEGREKTLASAGRHVHFLIRLLDMAKQQPQADATS